MEFFNWQFGRCAAEAKEKRPSQIQCGGVLHNKEVNGKDAGDHTNFSDVRISSVIDQAEGLRVSWICLEKLLKLSTRSLSSLLTRIFVEMLLWGFLFRCIPPCLGLKLTYPQDIGGPTLDGTIDKEMVVWSMSQTVVDLIPPCFVMVPKLWNLPDGSEVDRGLRSDCKRSQTTFTLSMPRLGYLLFIGDLLWFQLPLRYSVEVYQPFPAYLDVRSREVI